MKRFLYFLLAALMLLSILPAAALSEPGGTDADPFADISTPHLLLMEAESGRVLYERAADERAFPASTTKLMTALIAVEEISDFDREITLGWREVAGFGANSSLMGLEASETIRLEDVLYGMLLRSGNDAAKTIAMQAAYAHYGEGTDPARAVGLFVNLMNAKAQELGMNSTHFVTVDGRHDPDHYTTAHDFGILMREVIKHQYLIDIMSSPTHTVAPTNKHPGGFYMENSNKLICTKAADTESFLYDKCLCGKTGETNDAGYCLVSCAASRSGRLILVQFGDSNSTMSSTYRYTVAKRMYEWGFDQLSGSAPTDEPTDLPAGEDPFADIAAPHILLIETGSGEVLYERGANGQAFPADVTILMTALVAIEEIPDFNEKVTLGWREVAGFTANSTLMGLEAAETIKLEDLLYGMLLCSGADAAKALAMQAAYAHYGEGTSASEAVSRFVDLMNKKARELGMNSTRFVTVDGRHNPEHYTTAHDLGLLMREVIKSQYITDILSVPSRNTEATNMHPNGFHLENTNRLINKKDGDAESFVYDKCLLGKSGATTEAGSCLASCAVSRDVKLILIQLGEEGGSANLYNSAKRIFEWGFQNYRDYQLSEFAPQTEFELRAINASPVDPEGGRFTVEAKIEGLSVKGAYTRFKKFFDDPSLLRAVLSTETVDAPIRKGDVIGHVDYYFSETQFVTAQLVALRDVAAGASFTPEPHETAFISNTPPPGSGKNSNLSIQRSAGADQYFVWIYYENSLYTMNSTEWHYLYLSDNVFRAATTPDETTGNVKLYRRYFDTNGVAYYVPEEFISDGAEYIIVLNGMALSTNGQDGTLAGIPVDAAGEGGIIMDGVDDSMIWRFESSGNGYHISNNSRYLGRSAGSGVLFWVLIVVIALIAAIIVRAIILRKSRRHRRRSHARSNRYRVGMR